MVRDDRVVMSVSGLTQWRERVLRVVQEKESGS
jgi:hypothetical protein